MADQTSAAVLFARLQAADPDARVVLLAPARSDLDVTPVAERLLAGIGGSPRLIDLRREEHVPVDREGMRFLFARSPGYALVIGGGLLDEPGTVLASVAADGVIVVAQREKTTRADLVRVKREIESMGARLVGAVLID